MLAIRLENKIFESIINLKSRLRSLLLFGNPVRIKFGRGVHLSGQVSLGKNIRIRDHSEVRGNVRIEDNVYIHENVLIRSIELITIGNGTTINRNTCILFKVRIGQNCSIAPNVIIVGSNHIYKDPAKTIKEQGTEIKGIIIDDDVWIGANATILDGVTIGKGSIIAAGAVVNKDIPPYSVAGGVPVRILKDRK
jgi:acetyltransferase-like isoleucine patch superfamily enzyme